VENIYTVQEVAALMKVKPRTVMEWLKIGRLGGFKLTDAPGSEWRITEANVQRFIEERTDQALKPFENDTKHLV